MYQSDQHVLQLLLRGRLLRNERPVDEERLPLVATTKLVQLRQRHGLWSQGQIGSSGSVLYVTDGSKDYGLFFGHLPSSDEKGRTFKFPFIVYEIFTCEVDIILKALVEDEELMNMLFSFLEPEHPHSALLAGYFSKVVCRAGPSIIQMKLGL
ncbi:putative SIT4 phosphatase-associated protein family [Helianthus annuus]|nr:putative SIT4 phosphatase-associated protein family [Helianthus annuus]KAJ0878209.1 putative SIT4 phosphatase-associated protein family [Helianthus annuus]